MTTKFDDLFDTPTYNNIFNCGTDTILTDDEIIKALPKVKKYMGPGAPLLRELNKKEKEYFIKEWYGELLNYPIKRIKVRKKPR